MSHKDVQEIRDAFELIVSDAPDAPDFDTPFRLDLQHSSRSSQSRRWLVATAAAAAVLVTVGVFPLLVNGGGGSAAPAPDEATAAPRTVPEITTTMAIEPVPVWPPAPSDVVPPVGATWVCPPIAPGSDTNLSGDDIPGEVRYLPAMPVETMFVRGYGPACHRNPAMVAMEFTDSDRTSANAAVVVWVESPSPALNEPRIEPLLEEPSGPPVCYEDPSNGSLECFYEEPSTEELAELSAALGTELRPTTRIPSDSWTLVERNGFTIRNRNDRNEGNGRVEMVGVINGLPVWIEASGLAIAELETLVQTMTANSVTGQVQLPVPAEGIDVVHSAPVIAEVVEMVVLHWDASGFDGEVWLQTGYIPYTLAAFSVEWFGFTPVGDTVGVFAREGGDTGALTWQVAPGVVALLGSDAPLDQMIAVAETFQND